jgi:acetyl-CoA C-acetyltransferase
MSRSNAPVLVGLAQLTQRGADPAQADGPLEMLATVAREAADDAHAGSSLLNAVDTLALVSIIAWHPQNPNRLLAERLGIQPKTELLSALGGEMALSMVNQLAERIQRGEARVALVAGVNNLDTLIRAQKAGIDLGWPTGGAGEPLLLGKSLPGGSERESAHGAVMPTSFYPLIETALRARRGLTPDAHAQKLGELMSPFTRVAAQNPYAWFPTERSPEELVQVTAQNRMISTPYPKYLNAVLNTDQAAAVVLCSAAAADELGIPEDRRVHWWGGANTRERAWNVSERPAIGTSESLAACAQRTLANAQVAIDDIGHIDFYSCFPVAVEAACEAYGVAENDPRGLTVTGGLPYAGGPANNYTLHSLAALASRLREHPGDKGLVTGNGWYLTKHSASVWSTAEKPGAAATSESEHDPIVGAEPLPTVDAASGAAVIDTYTVAYDREGAPESAIVIGRESASGARFVANTPGDRQLLEGLVATDAVGRGGLVQHVDGKNRFDPS